LKLYFDCVVIVSSFERTFSYIHLFYSSSVFLKNKVLSYTGSVFSLMERYFSLSANCICKSL